MDQPYKPSLIDRFTQWVGNLSIREWVFYVTLTLILILIQVVFFLLDGGQLGEPLLPVIIFNGLATPFLLILISYLDKQAVMALSLMKPALEMSKSEFEKYRYMLSTMPARPSLVAGLVMLGIAILTENLSGVPVRYAALEQLPDFSVVFHIVDKSSAFLFGSVMYHTVRQLLLVNRINSKHVRINLFRLRPLQGFSRLTATTAIAIVAFVYLWMLINPELLNAPIIIGYTGTITALALAVFIWPLYGLHRLMEQEKDQMLHALDLHFEDVFSKFDHAIDEDDHAVIERLNGTIASLEAQHNRITLVPTWPWRPETARFVLTAIASPLVLAILRFVIDQVFGG